MAKSYVIAGARVQDDFIESVLQKAKEDVEIIAVDAGLKYLYKTGVKPDIVIGDFDSADTHILEKYTDREDIEIIRYNPVKDASDLDLALSLCKERNRKEIYIFAALGARMDHTLSNLLLLCKWSAFGMRIFLLDKYNKIYVAKSNSRIYKENQYGKYISFFSIGAPVRSLYVRGVKYPLGGEDINTYMNPSFSISNEITEEFAEISFAEGILLVMESRDGQEELDCSTLL